MYVYISHGPDAHFFPTRFYANHANGTVTILEIGHFYDNSETGLRKTRPNNCELPHPKPYPYPDHYFETNLKVFEK